MSDLYIEVDTSKVEAFLSAARMRVSKRGIQTFLDSRVADYLKERLDRRFTDEGDDASGGWEELKERTQAIRASRGFGPAHPINKRTGNLYRWVRTHRVGGDTLTMPARRGTTNLENALSVAQTGKDSKGKPVTVSRRVLAMNNVDDFAIMDKLKDWIEDAGKAAV